MRNLFTDAAPADEGISLKYVRIAETNVEKQIVYGVVYAPGELDTHGDMMLPDDIEVMCHRYMKRAMVEAGAVVDVEHDNVARAAYPVESWIEKDEDKGWPVGSWIMAVKIEDPGIWDDVKTGKLNGFSFEAWTTKVAVVVEVEAFVDDIGTTEKSEGHDHVFFVEFDAQGRVIGGRTSVDRGHWHEIKSGTATEPYVSKNGKAHAHRLTLS